MCTYVQHFPMDATIMAKKVMYDRNIQVLISSRYFGHLQSFHFSLAWSFTTSDELLVNYLQAHV